MNDWIISPYYNLKQNLPIFFIFNKKFWKECHTENHWKSSERQQINYFVFLCEKWSFKFFNLSSSSKMNFQRFYFFFYINRSKYWFRANLRYPVFDGFTRSGVSWTWFDCFWKMFLCLCAWLCVCVCVTKILWQVELEI